MGSAAAAAAAAAVAAAAVAAAAVAAAAAAAAVETTYMQTLFRLAVIAALGLLIFLFYPHLNERHTYRGLLPHLFSREIRQRY